MAYQRAYFPMDVINITQGYGSKSSSHKLSYALDLAGDSTEAENIYAPFDCKITKLYQPKDTVKHANTVWLTSTKKVLSPNGNYGYLTVSLTHPEEISNMKLGTTYKQGQFICKEGQTGRATGNHLHLEVSKGKTAGWSKKTEGNYSEYVILNKVKPEDYLFVKEDSKIKNMEYEGNIYNLVKESKLTYIVKGVSSEPLNVHKTPDFKSSTILKGKGLYNGDEVIKFFETGNLSYIYHYEIMGYVSSKYLDK